MPDMNENAETQQEYFGKVRTNNTKTLYNALNKIAELEKQIEQLTYLHNEDVNTIKLLNKQIKEIKEK